jgi:hypothetical protein
MGLRSLWHRPFRGILAVTRYYKHEFALRYSPKTLEKVCILGPGGGSKMPIAAYLARMLRYSAGNVEMRHCEPQLFPDGEPQARNIGADSLAEARNRSSISMPTIVQWVLKEWFKEFSKSRNLTLHISEGCYNDSLTALQWRRQNYPAWFAHLFAKIIPSYDLWILFDQHAKVLQSEKPSAPIERTAEAFEACLAFVKTKSRYVILDASGSTAEATEEAYGTIIETLARRTDGIIKRRFRLPLVGSRKSTS